MLVAVSVRVTVPDVVTPVLGSEQVTPAKLLETEQPNVTAPVNPRKGATVTDAVEDPPAGTLTVVGVAVI